MLVVKEANQEWLPEDWTVKIKRRSTGKKYKCYSDPSNQCRFYSKPEVLRYLKTMKQTSVLSNQEETCIVEDSASKVVCERSVEKDLPPGWVKELRIREGANKIRKDPYFTDPVSGYVFRSKKDVIRYIKTGQVSKRAFLPGKRHINDLELTNVKTSSLSVAKRQKQQYPATRQMSFAGMSLEICDTVTLESQSSLLRGPVRTRSALSKINEKCTSSNDQAFLTPAPLNNGIEKDDTGNCDVKSNRQKEIILRSQSSRRLAGVSLEVLKVKKSATNQPLSLTDDQAISTPASLDNGIDKDRTENGYGRSSKKKEIILPSRTSSRLAGNFVTPQAGKKFSSEDLIPNLKTDNSAQNELQTANTNIDGTSETTNMHVVKETNQEWLPVGWRVKIRQKSSGQMYKCYIDPSNQCRFYSKPEVLRYLKTMKQTSELSHQEEAGIVEDSASKVSCERSVDKDLPPGWIKELKTREGANKIRKDPYYTDPVSGYVFRSKKDVIRYVKTGRVSKHAFLPKKRHIDHLELAKVKPSLSPVAKKQKQQYNETRQRPFAGTSFDTWSTVTLKSQTSDLRGSVRTRSALSKINEKKTEKCASKNDQAFSTPAPLNRKKERLLPSRSSRRLAGVSLEAPKVENFATNQLLLTQTNAQAISTPVPLDNEIEKDHIGNDYGKSNKKKEIILPCRTSRRLAGVNLEVPEVENSATDRLPITPTDDKAADVGRNKSIESDMEKTSCTTENYSIKSNKKKRVDLPCRLSPRLDRDESQQSKVELSETNKQENPSSGDNGVFLVHVDEKSSSRGKSNKNKGFKLSSSSKRLGGTKLELPIVESQLESPSDPETILTSAADLKGEKLTDNGIRKCSSRMITNKSAKSNKEIEKKFPSRSSERCAGLATEISGEQMLQNTVGESDIEVGPTIKLILDSLAEEVSEGFPVENNFLLLDNKKSFDDEVGPNEHQVVETEKPDLLCGDPCREFSFGSLTGRIPSANVVTEMPTSGYAADQISEKSLDGKVGHKEQHQVVETEKPDLLCGDPCREFSFGSLTGTIPSADVVTEMPTSGYAADQISKNTNSGNFSRSEEKKEINVPGWSLAQTPEFQQVDDSAPQISCSKQGEEFLDLHLSLNPLADGTHDVPHEELSKNKEYLKNQIFGENDLLSNNKERMKDLIFGQNELGNSNSDEQMQQPFLPSGNYWSDPCLEFAYKTLTGAIPLDDEFTIPDYSHLPDTSQSEVENISVVPDFGFQSNISSHVDASGSQPTSQQMQLTPSVSPTPGTGNLPGFSAVGTQQPFVVQSDDIQANSSSQI